MLARAITYRRNVPCVESACFKIKHGLHCSDIFNNCLHEHGAGTQLQSPQRFSAQARPTMLPNSERHLNAHEFVSSFVENEACYSFSFVPT